MLSKLFVKKNKPNAAKEEIPLIIKVQTPPQKDSIIQITSYKIEEVEKLATNISE